MKEHRAALDGDNIIPPLQNIASECVDAMTIIAQEAEEKVGLGNVDQRVAMGQVNIWNDVSAGRNLAKAQEDPGADTRKLLDGMISISTELHRVYLENGSQAVAPTLSRFGEHPSAGVAQSQFLTEMAMLIKEGNEEVARVELSAFGALLLSAVYWYDSKTSVEALRDSLTKLFVAHQGRVNPLRSFSHWLERLEARTGYAKDKLLLDGFVHPVGKTGTLLERDPRNLIRNARRYRNGDLVPTFHKTQYCLRSLCPQSALSSEQTKVSLWAVQCCGSDHRLTTRYITAM